VQGSRDLGSPSAHLARSRASRAQCLSADPRTLDLLEGVAAATPCAASSSVILTGSNDTETDTRIASLRAYVVAVDEVEWRSTGRSVIPHVNGEDLRVLVRDTRLQGLDPALVKPPCELLLGVPAYDTNTSYDPDQFGERVPLLACGCGEVGCAAVTAVVSIERDRVVWDDLRSTSGDALRLGPFVFARRRYDAARAAVPDAPSERA
jgi:hypothetical protein